jgi:hypothetical protein
LATDFTGGYEVIGIDPGSYRVYIHKSGYVDEYWTSSGGTRDWSEAGLVTLGGDEVVEGIDFQLSHYAIIRGRVTDSSGDPIPSAYVYASLCQCYGQTDENGDYEITVVEAGDMIVSAWAWPYQTGYWTSTGSVPHYDEAEPIPVSFDQVIQVLTSCWDGSQGSAEMSRTQTVTPIRFGGLREYRRQL